MTHSRGFWGGEGREYVQGGVAGGPGGAALGPRAPADAEYLLGATNTELLNGRVGTDSPSIEFDFSTPGEVQLRKLPTTFALTSEASVASDWNNIADGGTFTLTTLQDFTLANPTNLITSKKVTYRIKQDGTGNRTITLDSVFHLGTDIPAVILTTIAGAVDYLVCYYDTLDNRIDIVALVKGY